MKNPLLSIGLIGAAAAAVCCFTPVLPLALGAVGLSGMVEYVYRDSVLLPILAGFLGLAGYALWRQKQAK